MKPQATKTTFNVPKIIVSGYEMEIRPARGLLFKWEGRVISRRKWEDARDWHTVHQYPTENVQGWVGGRGFWFPAISKQRLQRKLARWITKQEKEKARKQAVEVIPA